MKTSEGFRSANRVCIALTIILHACTTSWQNVHAAEPSAEEILAESWAAMNQPLKYRHVTSDTEMVVYQKTLPDGSPALLMDMSSPIKKINIMYGDKSYDLYLEHGVAIDTGFMYQASKDKAASAASLLKGKAATSSKLVGTVQRDGKDCYVIESTVTPDAIEALAKVAPPKAKDMIAIKRRYVIEKNTHRMVEREVLTRDGSTLSKVEIKDIEPQPDLSDEFFLLPPGLKVKKPKSTEEYLTLITDMLNPDTALIALKKQTEQLKQRRPRVLKPPETPSREEVKKQFETYAKNRMSQVRRRTETPQPKSISTTRIILLVFSLVLFLLCVVFALYRLKKARTKAT